MYLFYYIKKLKDESFFDCPNCHLGHQYKVDDAENDQTVGENLKLSAEMSGLHLFKIWDHKNILENKYTEQES